LARGNGGGHLYNSSTAYVCSPKYSTRTCQRMQLKRREEKPNPGYQFISPEILANEGCEIILFASKSSANLRLLFVRAVGVLQGVKLEREGRNCETPMVRMNLSPCVLTILLFNRQLLEGVVAVVGVCGLGSVICPDPEHPKTLFFSLPFSKSPSTVPLTRFALACNYEVCHRHTIMKTTKDGGEGGMLWGRERE